MKRYSFCLFLIGVALVTLLITGCSTDQPSGANLPNHPTKIAPAGQK